MLRYVVSRLGQAAITIFGISLIVFALGRMSGDPGALLVPPDATPEERQAIRDALGLDRSLPEQYGIFMKGVFTGDFGDSFKFGRPALDVFRERFPNTLKLAAAAAVVALAGGVLVGVLGAVKAGGIPDRIINIIALLGQAVPSFAIAIVLMILFSVELRWLPTSGMGGPKYYIMPAVSLAWYSMAALTRMTKSSMLDVMESDYIRLARLKGVPERTVIWKHAFRNALIPILSLFSLQLIFFISGSVIIESIFAWPGIGQLTVQAIFSRDYPLVQTIVLITSTFLVLLNMAVDVLYAYIDPRIRLT